MGRRLSKHGHKTKVAEDIGISRAALGRLLNKGTVRRNTLVAVVRKIEGETANVEDYIINE